MVRVKVVAEEASGLEETFVREKQVFVIPFKVIDKNGNSVIISPSRQENPDRGVFKSKDSFFRYLQKVKKKDLPTTGAISLEKSEQFLREASRGSTDVVCVLFPKQFSKIFKNVERAAERVSADLNNHIEVVDSKQAFSAQYFIAKEAAELAAEGKKVSGVVDHVKKAREKVHLYAAIYKLRYLRRSGRVKRLKKWGSILSDFLGLSSIITLKEGNPIPVATTPKVNVENKIFSEAKKVVGYKEKISIRINYGGEKTRLNAQKIEKRFIEEFDGQIREISSHQMGKVVGCHTGPHVLSVALRKFGYRKIENAVLWKMFTCVKKKLRKNMSTLNRLNIYPVIDGDTGKNFLFSFHNLTSDLLFSTLGQTIQRIASRIREDGTGFSGTAMSAYVSGFAAYISENNLNSLQAQDFVKAMEKGTRSAYHSFRNPKEGTILSAMRVSSEEAKKAIENEEDIAEILKRSYQKTLQEVLNPEVQEIPILRRKRIVDAGALGFVDILEGWLMALGKEMEIEGLMKEFRDKIKVQKSGLDYKREEAKHPGFCLKINIEGLKRKEELVKELESLPNPIESPLSIIHHHLHIHVYNEELLDKVLSVCNKYGNVSISKKSPLSQKEWELFKNKIFSFLGKVGKIPRLVMASLYWFGLRLVFPFREIKLWKHYRNLFLVNKALQDSLENREVGLFVFDRKGRIRYFNKTAQEYAADLGIEKIKLGDQVKYYLHPQLLKKLEGNLFSSGKNEPFLYREKQYTFELTQIFKEEEHIGAKMEIKKKKSS
ncbi:DegV family EDD domain-containing protein [bacterium]|nr:DegV family EDD domain-containing protein [bacterium]